MDGDNLDEKVKFQSLLASLDDRDNLPASKCKRKPKLNMGPPATSREMTNPPCASVLDGGHDQPYAAGIRTGKRLALTRSASPKRPQTAPTSSESVCSRLAVQPLTQVEDFVGETPTCAVKLRAASPVLRKAMTLPTTMPSYHMSFKGALPRGTKKHKRAVIKLAPENRRIFTGLVFFYVRNNDINAARRLRICKAIEYGAAWANEWHPAVTHIIADLGLNYEDILKELRVSSVHEPPPGVILVNETYASDCLAFRRLLNPKQHMYDVAGYRGPENAKSVHEQDDTLSKRSLQIKTAKGKGILGIGTSELQPDSQSRSETEKSTLFFPPQTQPADPQSNEPAIPSAGNPRTRDDLDEVIDTVKETRNLPLDPDEESSQQTTIEETSSEDESYENRPLSRGKRKLDGPALGFQCLQKPGSLAKHSANQEVIDILQQMATYYDSINDTWRTLSYRKAMATLRRTEQRITTSAEAIQLPAIGQRLADKIEEIAVTHRLRRLESTHADPTDIALRGFLAVYSVGIQQAMRWVQQGYRSLEDLLAHVALTANQRIGIAHVEDFATRIPRDEVARLGAIVTSALHNIDASFQVTIGGSYRRGAATSGDIDLIITRPDTDIGHIRTVVLESLVPRLFSQNFLKAALASTNRDTGTKWHGACQLPASRPSAVVAALDGLDDKQAKALPPANTNPWRRIDLLLVPWSELGAAMIYFTGNDIFNRSMRLLARKRGMGLNQKGLYKNVLRGRGQVKLAEGELVESRDERRIFEILGVPWRTPSQRQI